MLNISTHYAQKALFPLSTDQITLDLRQAREHKRTHPEQADSLYTQVEKALLELAEQQNVQPLPLSEREERSETLQQEALRKQIAEVYVEHGEVLDRLKQTKQAQTCYEQAQAWDPLRTAAQLNLSLPATGPRFSLGRQAFQPAHYVNRTELTKLLDLLKEQDNAVIEVMGPVGAGKTTLLQHLSHPRPNPCFKDYDLLAWIDCRSVSSAHADIQAINHTLGHGNLSPQAALRQLANYVQQHPRSLLILDGVASNNIELISSWLKPLSGLGQLIYTTTQPLSASLSGSLGRPVKSLPLNLFNADQAKQLVQQHLSEQAKESLKDEDFSQVIKMTRGYPGVIKALCQHYQSRSVKFKNFADFLLQSHEHQSKRDALLGEIAQASLESLEEQALTDPIAARALTLLKQTAWLGGQSIPFDFFVDIVDKQKQVDFDAIQILYDKQLAMLEIDRDTQSLKLNSAFVSVVQKQFESEQHLLLEKNIQRLSEVFSYLTNNEGKQGHKSQPDDLKPYADLVDTLLFETCVRPFPSEEKTSLLGQTLSLSENKLTLLSQVLALGSSLARLYYLHHGALQLAYERLDKAQDFFKLEISEELMAHFEQEPESFTSRSISQEEAQLLKLYSQEYLYQKATLASQLTPRGQVPASVAQNFKKSYAIQVNLGEHVKPDAIAYTLLNFARALRKQERLINALETYGKLKQWMEQYPELFDEVTRAKLLIDQGIIEKEAQDNSGETDPNYTTAINMLRETHDVYLRNKNIAGNQDRNLGMVSIYLGEAYLADKQFELGIQHTCQILHYDGARQQNQARAYFTLARAFDEAGYSALAKLFIDQAAPLQIKAYQATTEEWRLKIEVKLLARYQKTEPLVQMNQWKTQTDLAEHCRQSLVDSSAPSQHLSLAKIQELEDQAYNWLWRHQDKTKVAAKRVEAEETQAKNDNAKKEAAERLEVQRQQDEVWYQEFAHRTKLDNPYAISFAQQFKEKLGDKILNKLREAHKEPMPMSRTELAVGLGQALSGLAPQIQVAPTAGVEAVIDLPTILQETIKTLGERKLRQQKVDAHRVADLLKKPEEQSKSLQIFRHVKPQIDEMADYAARCWQPVFAAHTWSDEDIQALAEDGVHHLMNYFKAGKVNELSSQERVVFALMNGEKSSRLSVKKEELGQTKGRWSTQGFFAKPGIKVETKENGPEIYFPSSTKAHPSVYGYRLGSPIEGRVGDPPYKGPFKNETEANQKAKEAREQKTSCVVM